MTLADAEALCEEFKSRSGDFRAFIPGKLFSETNSVKIPTQS